MKYYNGFAIELRDSNVQHLAIGFFDGLHRGHQSVILNEHTKAHLEKSCVLTFWPHPLSILSPGQTPLIITNLEEKKSILNSWGVGHLCVVEFTRDLANSHAASFLENLEKNFPKLKTLSVGPNFRFGKNRMGTPLSLSNWCNSNNIQFILSDFILDEQAPISSTRIRSLLTAGEIQQANSLLGRNYSVSGRVVSGDGIGRKLGYPTANVQLTKNCEIPNGVYTVKVQLPDNKIVAGVLNYGTRPTVQRAHALLKSFEVHLLEWTGNLYDKSITCMLFNKIREERHFKSMDHLTRQIAQDIKRCTDMLKLDNKQEGSG